MIALGRASQIRTRVQGRSVSEEQSEYDVSIGSGYAGLGKVAAILLPISVFEDRS